MQWLQSIDAALFHWVNPTMSNSLLDALMPFVSGNRFFGPAVVVLIFLMICKGGARGRICVAMMILAVVLGDSLVCNTLKHLIQRPRPFLTLADVHIPVGIGRTESGSMPSSHAANWFAVAMVAFIYYRRSWRFMLPMALIVCFSRVYNGVHYPSDVVVGAIVGAGYAACGVWTLDALWRFAGQRWFPLWWQRLPSLLNPVVVPTSTLATPDPVALDQHWLRFGYVLIAVQFVANLAYIASGIITLSEDEAYQWIWSKHLALSYYSKPPLIALTQFLGTHIWGDTVFGVRFSPVISALTTIPLFRFVTRVANVRAAFWLVVLLPAVPLVSVGTVLMTIDPLSVMFWTFAMFAGWQAIQEDSTVCDWCWVGLWMGLGFLSKYTSLFQLLCWAVFFALYTPARKQLRQPGLYIALLINLLCAIPVLIWNEQHHWITIKHVSEGGRFDQPWAFTPHNLWYGFKQFTLEFTAEEVGLQNPFFFLPTLWAAIVFWRNKKNYPLLLYFFSMGAPLFSAYFLLTFHSRSLPNWIAPSILPLFCLGAVYWEERWREGFRPVKIWLITGVLLGLAMVVLIRDTNLIPRVMMGYRIPADKDSTRRAKGWLETAELVEAARQKLLAEGKPVFIIGNHYGITGELTFNLPEARAGLPDNPLVYYQRSKTPDNQFFFWPGYENRKGQNALYVQEVELLGTNTFAPSADLVGQFESVASAGTVTAVHRGQPMHRIQIFNCRGLR